MQRLKIFLCLLALLFLAPPLYALEDVTVVHFVLDGVTAKTLENETAQGNLPNLKKHFWDNGAVFKNALTTFPTVSSPGYISFATGLGAGNSGVVFLEWFDRTKQKMISYLNPGDYTRVNDDLINLIKLRHDAEENLYDPLTLFEKLAPHPTAAVYTPFRRGATFVRPKKFPLQALFSSLVTKDGLLLNRLAMRELNRLFAQPETRLPRYTLVGLYGTDFYGHEAGPDSEEVRLVLKQFDVQFGAFVEKLRAQKLLEKTYLVVTSDHGMHRTGKKLELRDYLWKEGLRNADHVYLTNRGVSSAFIYLAGEEGWEVFPNLYYLRHYPAHRGTLDLIQTLLKNPAVDWIAIRDDFGRVRVYSPKGEGVITQLTIGRQNFYSYLAQKQDPLGFAKYPELKPMLDGKPYPGETWTAKTLETQRPNAIPELSHLFHDPRAGDILVVAKGEWGFRTAKAGTHGSLTPEDMRIPLWIRGPSVPTGRFGQAQSVDLYPTILNWFGLWPDSKPAHQEGRVLFVQNEASPTNPAVDWLARLEREMMDQPPLFKLPGRDVLAQRLRGMIPAEERPEVLAACEREIDRRYQRWKRLDRLEKKAENPLNPLAVPEPLRENTEWLLAAEKNIEFTRLRRMEDIQSILENR